MSVELPHRHGHQLLVREAVLWAESASGAVVRLAQVAVLMVVMMVAVMMERLVGLWGHRGWAVGVLAVMMMLAVWVVVSARVPGQFIGVVWDAPRIWVMMLLAVAVMAVVVVRASVTLESALLLQLLLDMRRWRMTVGCGSNQGLHCVLWGQA